MKLTDDELLILDRLMRKVSSDPRFTKNSRCEVATE